MNFSSPEKVASVIQLLKDAEIKRAPNRGLIDTLFNGAPPYTKTEADENKIQWNVNWGEGSDLLLQGREQLENAHLSTDMAFTIRVPDAPKSKVTAISQKLTKKVNKLIRGSRPYFHTQRSKWGSVILHGPGTQMWIDQDSWKTIFVPIADFLVPTDTELPLENLNHFTVRRRMSPGQLFRKTFGLPENKRDPAWNLDAVKKVLDNYKDINQNQNSWNWFEHPERMAELWKQNTLYYESDAVPVIWMWDFYFQEDDSPKPCWYRKILLDRDCVGSRISTADNPVVYLYDLQKPYAESIDQIVHVQFLDGNNVPPFMYHSCRGLGQRLHDIVHALNRFRCQTIQKGFEEMLQLFRVADPADRSRLDKIYFGLNYGVVPDGLSFVTRDQRYTPDSNLIQMIMSNLKQLATEGSQQYTQDIDTGTNKERTAFEVNALLTQTTRLTGSMLNLSYFQEAFAYREICRRLTKPNTLDWDAKKFQNECLEDGIPKKWIDSARWEIEPVRVLGGGNLMQEQAQAQAMLNIRPMLNPEAQQEVLNDYVFAVTHDPKRASRLVPIGQTSMASDTTHDTEIVFGALMSGSKVSPRASLIPAEVCQTMLAEMGSKIQEIMVTGGMGTPDQVKGLINASKYTKFYLQQLAQDQTMLQLTKQLSDALKNVDNQIKAMAQRLQQAAQAAAQQQNNAAMQEMAVKLQGQQALDQQKLQSKQAKDQQTLASKQAKDQLNLSHKDTAERQKLAHKQAEAETNIRLRQMESLAQVQNDSMVAGAKAASTAKSEE